MEYILGAISTALCVLLWYEKQENRKTIDKLTNALVAKNAKELRDLDLSDRVEPVVKTQTAPDLIEIKDLDEKEFLATVINNEELDIN